MTRVVEVRKYLPDMIGNGYKEFWNCRKRYRVCKGSRASKKSKTAALNRIFRILKYPEANYLCIRRYANTLRNSVYSDTQWAISQFGLDDEFKCIGSPLQIVYKKTGQVILFRGLDEGTKVTSITVPKGVLNFVDIEEAYEISQKDFEKLEMSIRGRVPPGYFKQITLIFNPWSELSWLKSRFFDKPNDNVATFTTTYRCNEWLDESDLAIFEDMKKNNPRRYAIEGDANWGIAEGLIYTKWEVKPFDVNKISAMPDVKSAFGLDFGYTNDPSALFCGLVSHAQKTIWVFDELYEKALTNKLIYEKISKKGYAKEKIIADSAEPKSIRELQEFGLYRMTAAHKGKDSINNGIQRIQDYHIIIHPRCVNFRKEISLYSWLKDKQTDKSTNVPEDCNNHLMDAMRYALEEHNVEPKTMRVNY